MTVRWSDSGRRKTRPTYRMASNRRSSMELVRASSQAISRLGKCLRKAETSAGAASIAETAIPESIRIAVSGTPDPAPTSRTLLPRGKVAAQLRTIVDPLSERAAMNSVAMALYPPDASLDVITHTAEGTVYPDVGAPLSQMIAMKTPFMGWSSRTHIKARNRLTPAIDAHMGQSSRKTIQ